MLKKKQRLKACAYTGWVKPSPEPVRGGGITRTFTRQFAIFSESLLADNADLLGNFKRIKTGVNRKNDDVFFFGPEIQDIKNYL